MLRYFARYFKRGDFGGLLKTSGTFGDFEGLCGTSGDLGTLEDFGRLWKTLEDVGRRGKTLGGFVNIWEIFGTIWDIQEVGLPSETLTRGSYGMRFQFESFETTKISGQKYIQ